MFRYRSLRVFLSNKEAATAIEYGLIAGLVGIAIISAMFLFSEEMSNLFNTVTGVVRTAIL